MSESGSTTSQKVAQIKSMFFFGSRQETSGIPNRSKQIGLLLRQNTKEERGRGGEGV